MFFISSNFKKFSQKFNFQTLYILHEKKAYSEFITENLGIENKVLDFEQFEEEVKEIETNSEDLETKEKE